MKRGRLDVYPYVTGEWLTATQIHNNAGQSSRSYVANRLRALASEGKIDRRVDRIDGRPDLLIAYYRLKGTAV